MAFFLIGQETRALGLITVYVALELAIRRFGFILDGRFPMWRSEKTKSLAFGFLAALILAVGSAGCRKSTPRADLVILNGAEPESLDPAAVTSQPDLRVVSALFEGLTRPDPITGNPIPGLAERWEISTDQAQFTFYLRSNAVWSTGESILAEDVVYSWRRTLDPATASDYAGQLFYLKNAEEFNRGLVKDPNLLGIQAVGSRILQVTLKQPSFFFLDLCTLPALAVVPRRAIEQHGDFWIKARPLPVSGAYELDRWRVNDRIRLRKNPRYWDAANTQNQLVDILPIGSASTALNLFMTGGADIVWDKELIPVELLDLLLKRPDFHPFDYLGTYFIRFNVTQKPFDDPQIRRALALAIDKRRLVEKITRAGEKPAGQMTPPGVPDYTPPGGLNYNPELGRQLLRDAGYPEGRGFPAFKYMFNAAAGGVANNHQKIGVELQQMWKETLGIDMELRQVETAIFFAAQTALDYQVCRSSWVGDYNDPNTFLDLFLSHSGNNRTGWKNERFDQLLESANRQTNGVQRKELLGQAEQLLVEKELPIIPLYFYRGVSYYDSRKIQGVHTNILDLHPINAIRKIQPD